MAVFLPSFISLLSNLVSSIFIFHLFFYSFLISLLPCYPLFSFLFSFFRPLSLLYFSPLSYYSLPPYFIPFLLFLTSLTFLIHFLFISLSSFIIIHFILIRPFSFYSSYFFLYRKKITAYSAVGKIIIIDSELLYDQTLVDYFAKNRKKKKSKKEKPNDNNKIDSRAK